MQDVGADGDAQRLDEVVLGEPGDGGEQRVLDGGAALGDDPGDALGALGRPSTRTRSRSRRSR
ncbi:hypothetical protein O1M63_36070 [Streptomyces mirabilis]|nr:hypothetical protein [Streptomyces mirabilis]